MAFLTSSSRDGATCSLHLHGEVDLAAGPALRRILEDTLRDDAIERVRIDLADVTFIDCGGIGLLVYGQQLAAKFGRELDICNARGMPLRLLRLTRLV